MPRKGDLIFVRNYNFIASAIRVVTKGEVNHVAMFKSDREIIEAKFGGVAVTPYNVFVNDEKLGKLDYAIYGWKEGAVSEEAIDGMIAFMERQIGRKYDFLQLLSIAFFLLFKISLKIEPIDIRQAWLCSELVAEAAYPYGIQFDAKVDPDNMSPQDIMTSDVLEKIYGTGI
jgi:uncharacterized protein YycO